MLHPHGACHGRGHLVSGSLWEGGVARHPAPWRICLRHGIGGSGPDVQCGLLTAKGNSKTPQPLGHVSQFWLVFVCLLGSLVGFLAGSWSLEWPPSLVDFSHFFFFLFLLCHKQSPSLNRSVQSLSSMLQLRVFEGTCRGGEGVAAGAMGY